MRSCHVTKDEGEQGVNHVDLGEECSRRRGKTSKGPEIRGCLACTKPSKEPRVSQCDGARHLESSRALAE